jgi:hypothetical protein
MVGCGICLRKTGNVSVREGLGNMNILEPFKSTPTDVGEVFLLW